MKSSTSSKKGTQRKSKSSSKPMDDASNSKSQANSVVNLEVLIKESAMFVR